MNGTHHSQQTRRRLIPLAVTGGLLLTGGLLAPAAHASLSFYSVTLGQAYTNEYGLFQTDPSSSNTLFSLSGGNTTLNTNVAIATGNVNISSNNGTVGSSDKVYVDQTSSAYSSSGSNQIANLNATSSQIVYSAGSLTTAISQVETASENAKTLGSQTGTLDYTLNNIYSSSGSIDNVSTIDLTSAATVFNVDDWSSNKLLTISATSSSDYVIFDITNGFVINNPGGIVTSGIDASHVLFNVISGNVTSNETIDGTVLAVYAQSQGQSDQSITIHDATFTGGIIGSNITITSNPTIVADVYSAPEPSQYGMLALIGLSLTGLMVGARRKAGAAVAA